MRIPRSPTGSTSGRRSANIRNICAVHVPIPFTCVSRSITSAIAQSVQVLEHHLAVARVPRQIANVFGLGLR